jgi:ubiquinone/menaquinone biosynthesis C-methylase UbiE
MIEDSQARFGAGAEARADYNQKPLGRIRREVTWRTLAPHLPDVRDADDRRVLDAGGGSGELALHLVWRGYRVWLLDDAAAMLDHARTAAQDLSEEQRARLTYCLMKVEDAAQAFALSRSTLSPVTP